MAFRVNNIFSGGFFTNLRLLAGKEGLDRPVNWVTIIEVLAHSEVAQKGELLLTTGYDLEKFADNRELIPQLMNKGVSGLMIKLGVYIDYIPDQILAQANQYHFPILLLPPEYSFSDVTHTLIEEIQKLSQKEQVTDVDYTPLLLEIKPQIQNLYLTSVHQDTTVHLLSVIPVSKQTHASQLNIALEQIRSFLISRSESLICKVSENGFALYCFSTPESSQINSIFYDLQILLTFLSERDHVSLYIGSAICSSPDQLSTTFNQTHSCIKLLKKIKALRGVCPYNNYSFIQLIGQIYQNTPNKFSENEAIRILKEKDGLHNTNYMQTLRIYLSESCNTTHTAERLFIHRHTLINKLQTITDLCKIDLNDYYTRVDLSLALIAHDLYNA